MERIDFVWTDGKNEEFQRFYIKTEEYYSKIVGGSEKRKGFVPFNLSESISDVLLAYIDGAAAGCAGLKKYSDNDVEIKRVWVEPDHRGKQIATKMMDRIEEKARMMNFRRAILQTRPIMTDAVGLYERRGYKLIENYPPYDKLDGAICMALSL
ncbi:MAG: GNAT family N-acetyltransferase [Lachnospiraceae bacterium]|nr:GNAT family N-acetyltransferase [Lachnospiraceae bacterium]